MMASVNDNDEIEGLLPAPISRRLIEVGFARASMFYAQCRAARPGASENEARAWLGQMRQDVQRLAVETLDSMVDFGNEFDPEHDVYFERAIAIAQHGADRFFAECKRGQR